MLVPRRLRHSPVRLCDSLILGLALVGYLMGAGGFPLPVPAPFGTTECIYCHQSMAEHRLARHPHADHNLPHDRSAGWALGTLLCPHCRGFQAGTWLGGDLPVTPPPPALTADLPCPLAGEVRPAAAPLAARLVDCPPTPPPRG